MASSYVRHFNRDELPAAKVFPWEFQRKYTLRKQLFLAGELIIHIHLICSVLVLDDRKVDIGENLVLIVSYAM